MPRLGHRHLHRGQSQSGLPLRSAQRARLRDALGARLVGLDIAKACVTAFLKTEFASGRPVSASKRSARRRFPPRIADCQSFHCGRRRQERAQRPAQEADVPSRCWGVWIAVVRFERQRRCRALAMRLRG